VPDKNLEKALGLAALGLWVFPCYPKAVTINGKFHGVKSPIPWRGFYEATTNPDVIREFWRLNPGALVGVWAGKSRLIILDLDISAEKGKDGKAALSNAGVYVPPTYFYTTLSGGEHHVFDAGDLTIGPTQDHTMENKVALKGVDRRSGGSYVIWWGDVPPSREVFLTPPQWFQNDTTVDDVTYEGTYEEWMSQLVEGEPDRVVQSIVSRIPRHGFSHGEMIKLQTSLIIAGAEGRPGVAQAIETVRDDYLGGGYDTPKWRRLWEQALVGGIARFGGAPEVEEPKEELEESPIPEHYTKFQEIVKSRLSISLDDLAQALDTACSRLVPNWEEVRATDPVASQLRRCLRLLTAVDDEEKAMKWLTNTKKFMQNVLGENRG